MQLLAVGIFEPAGSRKGRWTRFRNPPLIARGRFGFIVGPHILRREGHATGKGRNAEAFDEEIFAAVAAQCDLRGRAAGQPTAEAIPFAL